MPNPGQANNPGGINNWQGFQNEEPYGQMTRDAALQGAAPVAGGPVTVGALAAPKRAQRSAQKPPQASMAPAGPQELPEPPARPPQPSLAQVWQQIAATPGASSLVADYAARVAR